MIAATAYTLAEAREYGPTHAPDLASAEEASAA